MVKIIPLQGEERVPTGKGFARTLRNNGSIPIVIYGKDKNVIHLHITEKNLTAEYLKNGFMSHLFDIQVGKNTYRAIPKDIQLHPVTDRIIHADFMHVDVNSTVKVPVAIDFINRDKCIGIKQGGTLNIVKHEVEIECSATEIPEKLTHDINNLNIGDSIHISDLVLPKGTKTVDDGSITIATISGRSSESTEESTEEEVSSDKTK